MVVVVGRTHGDDPPLDENVDDVAVREDGPSGTIRRQDTEPVAKRVRPSRGSRPIEIPPRQPRVDPRRPARADPFVDTQSTDTHVGVTQPAGHAKRSHPLRKNPVAKRWNARQSFP
jgi:hypothetical protein